MLRFVGSLVAAVGFVAATVPAGPTLNVFNSGTVEYVEITASPDTALVLNNWLLVSSVGDQKLRLAANQIPAGGTIRIVSGTTPLRAGDLLWTRRNVWNNDGDVARLFDSNGTLTAEVEYGKATANTSSALKAASSKGTRTTR